MYLELFNQTPPWDLFFVKISGRTVIALLIASKSKNVQLVKITINIIIKDNNFSIYITEKHPYSSRHFD